MPKNINCISIILYFGGQQKMTTINDKKVVSTITPMYVQANIHFTVSNSPFLHAKWTTIAEKVIIIGKLPPCTSITL